MMVTNWFVEKRGIAMSVTMAGIGLGGTIFSPIVTNLLQNYGWRHTYLIMAGIILVVALPVALFVLKMCIRDRRKLKFSIMGDSTRSWSPNGHNG